MVKVKDLVIQAKKELIYETQEKKVDEIKIRLSEIISAKKTLEMLEKQYEQRLVEIENEINSVAIELQ